MGLTKKGKVKPMTEEMAIDLAADMLGEAVIFSVAVGALYFEYWRGQRKDAYKEDIQNNRLTELDNKVTELSLQVEEQNAHIRELNRLILSQSTVPKKIIDSRTGTQLTVEKPK